MAFKLFRKNDDEDANRQERASRSEPAAAPVTPAPVGISTQSGEPASGQQTNGQQATGQQASGKDSSAPGVRALEENDVASQHEKLPQRDGYTELVALMDKFRVSTLQLDQRGNEMTAILDPDQKPERKTVVDTESSWFEAVAQLYTAGQRSSRGPWRRAQIVLSEAVRGQRTVDVDFTYPNSADQQHETYVQSVAQGDAAPASARTSQDGVARDGAVQDGAAASSAASSTPSGSAGAPVAGAAAGTAAAGTAAASGHKARTETERPQQNVTEAQGLQATGTETREADRTAEKDDVEVGEYVDPVRTPATDADYESLDATERTEEPRVMGAPAAEHPAAQQPREQQTTSGTARTAEQDSAFLAAADSAEQASTEQAGSEQPALSEFQAPRTSSGTISSEAPAAGDAGTAPAAQDAEGAARGSEQQSGVSGAAVAGAGLAGAGVGAAATHHDSDRAASEQGTAEGAQISAQDQALPDRVDDGRAFQGGADSSAGAGRHASATLPDSAPTRASGADVAPSYRAPAEDADALRRPSTTTLAPGNLVLSEADVVRRLRDAQKSLFGPEGTARDASTVLIRVRALGTYFDALTHVRHNGFWDQRKTFDLVPEDALQVLELKKDSYTEGQGAPIALMYRFTPGVPPQVSFDYADEERFVKYEDRLPAQQYIEELRMYPRTGANIPEHMNEALTQWTL